MPDRLDKSYYWHIITLAIMKNNLKLIRKKELTSNTDQSIKN
jgi:hypothetical protein